MTPRIAPQALAKATPQDSAIRFVFGGLIAAGTLFIAKRFGHEIGGLFLAFPAILPASLTPVTQQDSRSQAIEDSLGAQIERDRSA